MQHIYPKINNLDLRILIFFILLKYINFLIKNINKTFYCIHDKLEHLLFNKILDFLKKI